jgi:ribosomal protein S18 acetylase RimI-like enzyme
LWLAGLIPGEDEAELERRVSEISKLGIGQQLAETVIETARMRGVHQLKVRPVARNELAIRFFHKMGFDILGQIELFMDFSPVARQVWKLGERVADRDFRV